FDCNFFLFFFQAEDGIRDGHVTGVQTCALPICFSWNSICRLHQCKIVDSRSRLCSHVLFQLQQVVWSLWKGLLEESRKQGELTRVDSGGLMQQGKHSLGHLFMEWHIVRPKTMLIGPTGGKLRY